MKTDSPVAVLDPAASGSVRSNARRDARTTEIHEGVSELRRLAVARHEAGLR